MMPARAWLRIELLLPAVLALAAACSRPDAADAHAAAPPSATLWMYFPGWVPMCEALTDTLGQLEWPPSELYEYREGTMVWVAAARAPTALPRGRRGNRRLCAGEPRAAGRLKGSR